MFQYCEKMFRNSAYVIIAEYILHRPAFAFYRFLLCCFKTCFFIKCAYLDYNVLQVQCKCGEEYILNIVLAYVPPFIAAYIP